MPLIGMSSVSWEGVNNTTVHLGYKGQLGPRLFVPYIRLSLISEAIGLFRGSSVWNRVN